MIWEILSFSRLHKMLKLRDTLAGMHDLKTTPRVWLEEPSASPSKGHNTKSHKELFQEMESVTLGCPQSQKTSRSLRVLFLSYLNRSQN